MTDLKPCPFCGIEPQEICDQYGGELVECPDENCKGYASEVGGTLESQIERWNTRPSPWISVSERLPTDAVNEDSKDRLKWCVEPNGEPSICTYHDGEWVCYHSGMTVDVVVWMPVPALPEVK